jgi:WD40-like Beta Propeller Repeat
LRQPMAPAWHRNYRVPALLRADRLVARRRHLIVNTRLATTGARPEDVWRVSLEAGGSAKAILSGPFPEYHARISPNGQWLAYVSEEAGRPVVSVRALSGLPRRLVVSSAGGSQPVWRRDGQELLYVDLEGRLRGRSV